MWTLNGCFSVSKWLKLGLVICSISALNGGYVVTTPRKWVSGEASQVCVTLPSPFTPEDIIFVEVKSKKKPADNEEQPPILPSKQLNLPAGVTNICDKLILPETKETRGELHVTGKLGGVSFNDSKPINIEISVMQTFLQTDKFLYKPSQVVQFRILTVYGPYLKVSTDQYDEIWIENPSGTRISQWLNEANEKGLIHLSFTLSDEPEEGTYKIRVRSPSSKIVDRTFKVEEYVLPKYEVTINPPPFILGTSESFDFEVCAKYTFGQPVKGNVTITVDNGSWGNYKKSVKKEANITGCKKFTVNATDLSLNGDDYYAYSLNAKAVVMEEGTGVELPGKEASVDVDRTALSFEDVSVQKFHKPELPYVGEVKVSLPDKSAAANESIQVCCNKACKNMTTNLNGILKYAVPPHMDCSVQLKSINYPRIQSNNTWRSVMYESSFFVHLKKYHSPSNSSLVIALDDTDLECSSAVDRIAFNVPVRFSAAGEQASATFTVQVISRGQIQFSSTFEQPLSAGSSLHFDDRILIEELKEPVTKNIVRGYFDVAIDLPKTVSPKAKVIIWYARADNEVVSDARELDIAECLLNTVNMTWSAEKVQPGAQATLSIKAEPLSLCSLGIVDKSVQLLSNKENSLTVKALLDLADKGSVSSFENLQVDDYKYCQGKSELEPSTELPPLLPPVALPLERRKREAEELTSFEGEMLLRKKRSLFRPWPFYSDDIDSLYMFDKAGIYIFSDLQLESRPCKRRHDIIEDRFHGPPSAFGAFGMGGGGGSFASGSSAGGFAPGGEPDLLYDSVGSPGLFPPSLPLNSEERTYFPETWLWTLLQTTETGSTDESLTLPDSVTEWVGSAVCVHPSQGVGISPPVSITTFRDFFADLTLPPSVKRGETFPVKISVFNYMDQPLPLKVILEESPEYDILADTGADLGSGERSSCLPNQDKVVHSVRIRPNVFGDVNITVSAFVDVNAIDTCGGTGSTAEVQTDVLVKPIRVEIEGFLKEKALSQYVCTQDLLENADALEAWTIETPPSIIPDSARGFVAVVGDLMGPTLENLGSLVKMPYGCGEQNMLNFAPNIFVMQYLDAAQLNNQETADKALGYMEKGYQRELNYRHSDGSFSAFGERDESGSTWLTAFVLKSFAQARAYISVDKADLTMSTNWLKRKQLENGCFESVGKVLHKGMKGGVAGSTSPTLLSSFVLIALLEAGERDTSSTTIREALFCLNADLPTKNPYEMAVKSYALALANSPEAQKMIDLLMLLAENQATTLNWKMPKVYEGSAGVGIETAGYVVLALLTQQTQNPELDYTGEIRKIIKWINNQRNGQGGFISTQDTIVALQALAAFESSISQGPIDVTVIAITGTVETSFTVKEQNKLLQQKVDIPSVPTTVEFAMEGVGCVLLQAILRYNVPEAEPSAAFSLRVETATAPDLGCKTKRIKACASYLLEDKKSNMAIVEVTLVSGYIPKKADLKQLVGYGSGLYKRYEVDGSVVTIYIDEFSPEEICVSFRILREVEVEEPKEGTVKVYDYYKPEYFVTEKYTLPPVTECLNEKDEFSPLDLEIIVESPQDEGPSIVTENLGDQIDAFDAAIL